MSIELSIFDLLIIIGMATGTICGVLLLNKSVNKVPNMFLGLGILGFVWLNSKLLLNSLDLWKIHGLGFFPNGVELALPPLFYLYLTSIIQPKFELARKHWLHFIPFLFSQVYAIIVYVAIMQTPLVTEKTLIGNSLYFNKVKHSEEYLMLLSAAFYIAIAFRPALAYRRNFLNSKDQDQFPEFNFLRNIVICLLIILAFTLTSLVVSQFINLDYKLWQFSHLLIAGTVYYMGLVGYKNSDLLAQGIQEKSWQATSTTITTVDPVLLARLNSLIKTERVHLDPKLGLQGLAKLLEVSETVLSATINAHYQKNFRSFINELRVEEVKQRLLNEGLKNLSLFGLASECGFNSEASFYRIFKATSGFTPRQFLAKQTQEKSVTTES